MRLYIRHLVGSVALLAAVACSDSPTSPAAAPTKAASQWASAFDDDIIAATAGPVTTAFTVTSAGGAFALFGNYTITFPPNSLCDPSSSYGPTEWDKPCTLLPAGQSVLVFAIASGNGTLGVDFIPRMRFSPTTTVTISNNAFASTIIAQAPGFRFDPSRLNPLAIYYSSATTGLPFADFATDPSLITHIDLATGLIWRRIKHFSGYLIGAGTPCTPGPDMPECVQVDGLHE